MQSLPPSAIVAQVRPAPVACPTPVTGVVAFGIDQTIPVQVKTTQSFILAMRGGAGESSIRPYQLRATPTGQLVTFQRAFTIGDATFANADRTPGSPMVADGPATQYFLFQTSGIGTTTVTFDAFTVANPTVPHATKTFTIVVTPYVLVC